MKRELAESLVNGLERHPEIISPDRNLFLKLLESTEVPESSKFYEELLDEKQLLEESDRYHYLSLRRILRNRNARNYRLSKSKYLLETMASALGIYSSDVLTRRLRANRELVDMMAESEHLFSLLGRFQIYDFDNPDRILSVISRPIIVIPHVEDTIPILKWERANTIYERESGIFRILKRISQEEYYAISEP